MEGAADAIEARRMAAGLVAGGGANKALTGKIVFAFALAKRDEVGWNDHERALLVRCGAGRHIDT